MSENSKINFEDTATAFAHKSDWELKKSHFVFSTMNYPWMVKAGTTLTTAALKIHLPVKGIIRKTLFDQFCGGESIEGSEPRMIQLAERNVKTILDYSVEGEANEDGYDEAMEEALRVSAYARQHVSIPFCVIKMSGLGSVRLMEKKQKGEKLTDEEQQRYDRMKYRIDRIVGQAVEHDMKFMIDAEESWIQDVIDEICYELMIKYNKEQPYVYNTYQLYRHEAYTNMVRAYEEVTAKGCYFAAKLVRGAYMEKERERAEEQGYPDPIQPDKAATDRDYNRALEFAIEHIDRFAVCAGTHNEASCQLLVNLMDAHGIAKSDDRVYFAQLLGMSDNISFKLADMDYKVAKYVPYGPVEKVLPYLFRRADENTSIAGQSGREFTLVKKEIKRRRTK
ncbi:proline dehydrogenase family protein [Marinoscillum furvescens]|uniref:L-proline dehydrogenase n=1 Tax=Marinoscillum furvescens DSM 4134 TaxID=1122208 RepID=A0A3D9KYH6_MARFU|nr:proline dehydrogenase family protein [Marinoscillum furvescens]RED92786.1 L-proline dehydrogenase [Marinoscillum furvescens DSM 4134]